MTFLGPAVRSILLSNSTLSGLIGTRIYPNKPPLDCSWPAISYSFPSDPFQRVVRGARVQVDCWAESYTACHTLADLIESTLNSFCGVSKGITIEGIYPQSPYDMPDDDTEISHIAYDFIIKYRT